MNKKTISKLLTLIVLSVTLYSCKTQFTGPLLYTAPQETLAQEDIPAEVPPRDKHYRIIDSLNRMVVQLKTGSETVNSKTAVPFKVIPKSYENVEYTPVEKSELSRIQDSLNAKILKEIAVSNKALIDSSREQNRIDSIAKVGIITIDNIPAEVELDDDLEKTEVVPLDTVMKAIGTSVESVKADQDKDIAENTYPSEDIPAPSEDILTPSDKVQEEKNKSDKGSGELESSKNDLQDSKSKSEQTSAETQKGSEVKEESQRENEVKPDEIVTPTDTTSNEAEAEKGRIQIEPVIVVETQRSDQSEKIEAETLTEEVDSLEEVVDSLIDLAEIEPEIDSEEKEEIEREQLEILQTEIEAEEDIGQEEMDSVEIKTEALNDLDEGEQTQRKDMVIQQADEQKEAIEEQEIDDLNKEKEVFQQEKESLQQEKAAIQKEKESLQREKTELEKKKAIEDEEKIQQELDRLQKEREESQSDEVKSQEEQEKMESELEKIRQEKELEQQDMKLTKEEQEKIQQQQEQIRQEQAAIQADQERLREEQDRLRQEQAKTEELLKEKQQLAESNETGSASKEEIKKELKEELRQELKQEIKGELKEELAKDATSVEKPAGKSVDYGSGITFYTKESVESKNAMDTSQVFLNKVSVEVNIIYIQLDGTTFLLDTTNISLDSLDIMTIISDATRENPAILDEDSVMMLIDSNNLEQIEFKSFDGSVLEIGSKPVDQKVEKVRYGNIDSALANVRSSSDSITAVDTISNNPIEVDADAKIISEEKAPPIEPPPPLIISKAQVFFGFDNANYPSMYNSELDKLIAEMQKQLDLVVYLEGYTDIKGSFEYNKALANRRSQSVADYFIAKGVDKSRIEILPLEREKILQNYSDSEWYMRRVDVTIKTPKTK
ncbi:MAG: OmpA family protein [Chitinophagales bacterium]|nr:OmpA family protein [Chitinophagales bacterium]